MKRHYFLVCLCLATYAFLSAQTCGDSIYDSGGSMSNYGDNENTTTTICPPDNSQAVLISFSHFVTEDGYDSLMIYNGNSSSAPLIGIYQGTNSPGTVVATNPTGCLTFVFVSDGSFSYSGWEAVVSCIPPVSCIQPTNLSISAITDSSAVFSWTANSGENQWMIEYGPSGFTPGSGNVFFTNTNPLDLTGLTGSTLYELYIYSVCGIGDTSFASGPKDFVTSPDPLTCGNGFFDSGGPDFNYSNNRTDTLTICRDFPNQTLRVIFSAFETELGFDSLLVYDGAFLSSPLMGIYQGTTSPDTLVAFGSCLTFLFRSDGSFNTAGWEAEIQCTYPLGIDEPEASEFSIYPNPSQGMVFISNKLNEGFELALTDLNGREIELAQHHSEPMSSNLLDLNHIQNGMYFLHVSSHDQFMTYQINIIK